MALVGEQPDEAGQRPPRLPRQLRRRDPHRERQPAAQTGQPLGRLPLVRHTPAPGHPTDQLHALRYGKHIDGDIDGHGGGVGGGYGHSGGYGRGGGYGRVDGRIDRYGQGCFAQTAAGGDDHAAAGRVHQQGPHLLR
ncbi:hypothetical protein FR742_40800 [Nonomuraea sp. C10]|nr:hypothetical protein FR742_40800 [Nonomuraea sp. C10]